MADYIYPAPGLTSAALTLRVYHTSKAAEAALSTPTTGMVLPTTATNSLGMNLVLNQVTFFGDSTGETDSAVKDGVFGLSTNKTRVQFDLYLGEESDGTAGKYMSGFGYITGLAPTVSADSPVWVSPITITVDSDFTVSDSAL